MLIPDAISPTARAVAVAFDDALGMRRDRASRSKVRTALLSRHGTSLSPVQVNRVEALAATFAGPSEHARAVDLLNGFLGGGPQLAIDVQAQVKAAGIASATLKRAREVLGIKSQRFGFGRDGGWRWALPATDPS